MLRAPVTAQEYRKGAWGARYFTALDQALLAGEVGGLGPVLHLEFSKDV